METTKFKPFDLEAAKAGAPVCTRDGRDVELLKFDIKSTNPIVGIVTQFNGSQECYCWKVDGVFVKYTDNTNADLVMKQQKKQGWKVIVIEKFAYEFKFANGKKIDGDYNATRVIDKINSQSQVDYIKEYYESEGYEVIVEQIEWEE